MRNYFRKALYLVVIAGFQAAFAGSYEDFFTAIKRDDPRTIATLLQRGFDSNVKDPKGVPGLLLALQEPSPKAAQVLIDWPKTKVELRNAHDESPLMMASLKGQTDVVRRLIARDADVNKPGWTALHYAATHGHTEIMTLLLDNHAYIDADAPNGNTPLMMAAFFGTPSAVKLLLEAGADPLLRNKGGQNAIDLANRAERKESADLIAAFVRARAPRGKW